MLGTFEANLQAIREHRAAVLASALEHLERCIEDRTRACEAVERLDPESRWAKDSRAQLAKARDDYANFAARISAPEALADAAGERDLPPASVIPTTRNDAPTTQYDAPTTQHDAPAFDRFTADSFLFAR